MELKTLQNNWDTFARHDPMWAILTDPQKRRNKWKADDFFKTGVQEITALKEGIQKRGYQVGHQYALDFWCGIGRLTQALAQYYEYCYGVDISSKMIELAKQWNQFGDRCQYILNETDRLPIWGDHFFDLIYTNIALQHIEKKYTNLI